jgi:hypothetical protein
MIINRRGLIIGLVSLVAAPAIVRASSLMPVRAIEYLSDGDILAILDSRLDRRMHASEVARSQKILRLVIPDEQNDAPYFRFSSYELLRTFDPNG